MRQLFAAALLGASVTVGIWQKAPVDGNDLPNRNHLSEVTEAPTTRSPAPPYRDPALDQNCRWQVARFHQAYGIFAKQWKHVATRKKLQRSFSPADYDRLAEDLLFLGTTMAHMAEFNAKAPGNLSPETASKMAAATSRVQALFRGNQFPQLTKASSTMSATVAGFAGFVPTVSLK